MPLLTELPPSSRVTPRRSLMISASAPLAASCSRLPAITLPSNTMGLRYSRAGECAPTLAFPAAPQAYPMCPMGQLYRP
ncbi:hypothetical protein EMPG_09862 [Blastomyces silverae]|uniref:Uncharacterized protein n=1 Tax=Blastomyces silverae TaxID=2060906 RepID=A0A0H1BIC9_9EURO|nr:hypothetical protein EMPG_09862 [Blastomyces silverae]